MCRWEHPQSPTLLTLTSPGWDKPWVGKELRALLMGIAEMPQIPFPDSIRWREPGARQSIGKVSGFPRGPAGRCRALPHALGQPVPRATEPREPRADSAKVTQ